MLNGGHWIKKAWEVFKALEIADSINDAVENYLDDEIGDDPYRWLKNYGYDIGDYIDTRKLKEQLVNDADYGNVLNSYDGGYDEIRINGNDYIVMRTN
jgi:hypothetical protein